MSFGDLLQSRRWKVFMNYVYNLAGALVIVGALFKLMHWPGAGVALTIGMCTEALIFLISSLEPLHEQPDWTRVFPELHSDHLPGDEEGHVQHAHSSGASHSRLSGGGNFSAESVSFNMGGIFESADIAPEVLEKVSKGLTDLGNTASSISDISSATLATNIYVENLNAAAESMDQLSKVGQEANININQSLSALSDTYVRFTDVVAKEIDDMGSNSANYNQKMVSLQTNLDLLNSNYAQQVSSLKGQFEISQKYSQQMIEMTSILNSSLEDMKKYQSLSRELNGNIEALNSVYSTMLSAMNYKK
ncbi:MAG: gliding motility protein GldL [Mangrovibacterium sp.]